MSHSLCISYKPIVATSLTPSSETKNPSGRSFHDWCSIGNQDIILFGGTMDSESFNDAFLLNCGKLFV